MTVNNDDNIDIVEIARKDIAHLIEGNSNADIGIITAASNKKIFEFTNKMEVEFISEEKFSVISGKVAAATYFDNVEEVNEAIAKDLIEISDNKEIFEAALKLITDEEVLGFGIDGKTYLLNLPKKIFAFDEECAGCRGSGDTHCSTCSGRGTVNCNKCHGQGHMMCQVCRGQRFTIDQASGQRIPCSPCRGFGQEPCMACGTKKQISCNMCKGLKKSKCRECDGASIKTKVTEVTYFIKTKFTSDLQNIPEQLEEALNQIGMRDLALNGHAQVGIIDAVTNSNTENNAENTESNSIKEIGYLCRIPMAKAEFRIDSKKYVAEIAGYRGYISKIDNFIDDLIKSGIEGLSKITKGSGDISNLIDKSAKFRIIRDVFTSLGQVPKKLMLRDLMLEYRIGLSEKYAKACIKYADQALKVITKKPRDNASLHGIIISAIIFAVYFLTPMRDFIPENIKPIIDIMLPIFLIIMTFFMIQSSSAKILAKILPKSLKGHKIAAPSGPQPIFSILIIIFMFIFAIEISGKVFPDKAKPEFYLMVRDAIIKPDIAIDQGIDTPKVVNVIDEAGQMDLGAEENINYD